MARSVPHVPGSGSCAPSWAGLQLWGGPAARIWGGGVRVPPPLRSVVGGPQRGGRTLCFGPSLCLPRVGIEAGFTGVAQSMEGLVSILLRLVSVRFCPGAVRGVPLRAGRQLAGRLAGRSSPRPAEVTVGAGG